MDGLEEKAARSAGNNTPKPAFSNVTNADKASDNSSEHQRDPSKDLSDDQYPHGFRLALLAGSSIVAVFLIALDQVRSLLFSWTDPSEKIVN